MNETLKTYRRDLHRIPELGFDLYQTKEYLLKILRQYDCEITEVCHTGICAFFRLKDPDDQNHAETIAFRSDMDGLPVLERNQVPYCSIHDGCMHACGHDGHMAMLLALAGEIDRRREELNSNVLLIFQPAEETKGGARDICETGILSRYSVKRIYGFHMWPMLEKHWIGSRANEFMAKSSEIDIQIKGRSAHSAYAEQGIDALAIGCRYLNDLYDMVKHDLPEKEYRLLSFGKMTSGTVRNAVSADTLLQGTLRCFNLDTFDFILKRMHEIAKGYENALQCKISITHSTGYPPVINHPGLFDEVRSSLHDFDFHTFEKPFMISEDFSFYQQEVPGLFLFLGTGTKIPLHSDQFDFDEAILETGLKAYLRLLGL